MTFIAYLTHFRLMSHPLKIHRIPTDAMGMGIHHSPHTHPIPIPMGIPMGISILTAALFLTLGRCPENFVLISPTVQELLC